MQYLVYLYFAFFVIFTGIHLYASYIRRDSLRAPTKPIILLCILGMYLEWMHFKGLVPSPYVVFALTTSWLGDVLLIPKGVKWFTLGGIAFWVSHFLFIQSYWESGIVFANIHPLLIVLVVAAYVPAVVVIFTKLKKWLPKALFYPMFFYLLTNGTMNMFAWFRLMSGSCSPLSGLVTALGALMFFISDSTLFFVRFDKNSSVKTHFLVMLTYSVGEFLIVLGLMMLAV